VGFVVDNVALEQASSQVLQFPLPISIPPIAPQLSPFFIWGWYNRPNSGRRTKWTQSHPMRKKKHTQSEILISADLIKPSAHSVEEGHV
jgi:hypothetical protein